MNGALFRGYQRTRLGYSLSRDLPGTFLAVLTLLLFGPASRAYALATERLSSAPIGHGWNFSGQLWRLIGRLLRARNQQQQSLSGHKQSKYAT
jgi:hypothetical protein